MKNKNTQTEQERLLYQLCCEDEFSNETIVCATYRHKSSAYRAKRRAEQQSSDCILWVKPITVADYNMEMVHKYLRESHQMEIEEQGHEFIDNHIAEICSGLYTIVNDDCLEKSIKRKLWSGQNEVRTEILKVTEDLPIESIYFSVMSAFRHGRYEFSVGVKTRENEYIETSGCIQVNISLSDTFVTLRAKISDIASVDTVAKSLKALISRQIYKRY